MAHGATPLPNRVCREVRVLAGGVDVCQQPLAGPGLIQRLQLELAVELKRRDLTAVQAQCGDTAR
jgi:hypothetical protein